MKWYQILWELPQTLLGWIITKCITIESRTEYNGRCLNYFKIDNWFSKIFSGTSLGFYILLPVGSSIVTVSHEYGHCLQSKKWKWLYLPVIGIPSICNNLRGRKIYKSMTYEERQADYYSRYPEKEADKLGGIVWVDGIRVLKDRLH